MFACVLRILLSEWTSPRADGAEVSSCGTLIDYLLICPPYRIWKCMMGITRPWVVSCVVKSRKRRIYVIKLTSLTVGNEDGSIMLLGLLAGYSGKKKKVLFRSLSCTVHQNPSRGSMALCLSTESLEPAYMGSDPGSATFWLCDFAQVTSLLSEKICLYFLTCKMGW